MSNNRRIRSARRALQACVLETLEERTLFSLVGVEALIQAPIVAVNSGAITYTAGTPAGSLSAQARLGVDLDGTSGFAFGVLTINATVDSSGNLVAPGTFTITSGANTLLSGVTDPTANQSGFGFDMTSGEVDFQFKVTGGSLLVNYATDDIGVLLNTEPPGTFPGFGQSFSMVVKGAEVGTIPEVGNAPASLFGHKYEDQTGDGLSADDLSHPLSGFTINLYADTNTDGSLDAGDALAGTTTTGADGSYSFTGLDPGTYFIQEVNQPTYTETAPPGNTYTVSLASGDNKGSFDFDNFKNMSISGTKFNDLNGNGTQDAGEPTLQGWTIQLYTDTGGTLTAVSGETTTTDANGNYSFTNLPPLPTGETYAVREVQQAGWTQTTTNPSDITIQSGENATGYNFGNFQLGKISGTKFVDVKGDDTSATVGTADDTPYAGGVTINLIENGSTIATTTTDANGNYSFTNLGAGVYTVQEIAPTGWVETAQSMGPITITSGTNSTGNNIADFQKGKISGTKYIDKKGNDTPATIGTSDDVVYTAGVTIELVQNGNVVASTVTDGSGNYSFNNLAAGTYSLVELVPNGWSETAQTTSSVTITSGTVSTGDNFADTQVGTIKGTKYVDVKGDDCSTTVGKNDDTAYTGPAITINLIQNGSIVATTTTDSHGNYEFDNVAAGTYTIQEVVPTGWVETAQSMGAVTVTSGATSTGNNIADFKLICISGTKFNDCTGNGFSSDDTGLAGITINLYKAGTNTLLKSTTTDSNGNYSFTGLLAGNYYVQEGPQPTGWTQTGGLSGYNITGTSGGNYTGNNFDDYHTVCVVTCFHYEINGCKIVNDISGQLHQGDVVKVIFTISGPGTVSFVSYTAPDSYFNANDADQQKLFDVATGTYTKAGTYSLTIVVPCCDYQVDFICGLPIDVLGTNSNVFYTPQNRLHDSDNGGSTSCIPTTASCNGGSKITGCIFNDKNNDSKQGYGENGICGVEVTCYGTTNDGKCLLVDCYTDSNGNYCFSNLPAGCYKVIEHDPDTYYDGGQCAGNYGGTCTDDICSGVVCSGTRTCSGYNFAELCGSDIQGTVFYDCNRDGKIESADHGIANVKLTLTGTDYQGNAVTLVTYTDANGNYDFGNLAAGTYKITETEPSGDYTTKNTAGTDGGTVSGDTISNIVVKWSTDGTGYNFGEI